MNDNSLKAIIWDLDGTLIHFNIDYIRARKITIDTFENNGIPKRLLSMKDSVRENTNKVKNYLENKNLKIYNLNEIIEKIDNEIKRIEYEAAVNSLKVKDIDKVLEFVKNKKIKQVIFTYKTFENAIICLEKTNLSDYFELVIGRDNIENPKPHEDHLLFICKKLNLSSKEILIIGDTSSDIECAIKIGANSIAINGDTPAIYKTEIMKYANFIIDQKNIPGDLIEAIKTFL
ncbi:MAG: HAD family hydrolase [Candidatus Lokiarchaeota archaeon]|nr:HAD family hydrolase [Candidatus Lokiarchaeota archaeon]